MRIGKSFMAGCIAALLFAGLSGGALGADVPWRGYEKEAGYQRITFGQYPTAKDGGMEPVMWRVLGVEDGIACLMTEYIIDFVDFHVEKDKKGNPLDYRDALIYETCNGIIAETLFSAEERAVLVPLAGERGILSAPSYLELHNKEYGFKNQNFSVDVNRQAFGTPYAHSIGLKKIMRTGQTWYWTTEWRRFGYRWIVGENGHISVSGIDRKGGLRPICNIQVDMLEMNGGEGTLKNPYQVKLKDPS